MEVVLVRACASLMVTGRDFAPGVVPLATAAWNEKILSLAVTSPWVPSSKNCCKDEPPIKLKLPTTPIPVLTGLEPGVRLTVRRVIFPACRLLGLAEPAPVGGVEEGVTVNAIEALALRA